MGSLKNLEYLNLSNANLRGRIPAQLGNLSKLEFLASVEMDYLVPYQMHFRNSQSFLQLLNRTNTGLFIKGQSFGTRYEQQQVHGMVASYFSGFDVT